MKFILLTILIFPMISFAQSRTDEFSYQCTSHAQVADGNDFVLFKADTKPLTYNNVEIIEHEIYDMNFQLGIAIDVMSFSGDPNSYLAITYTRVGDPNQWDVLDQSVVVAPMSQLPQKIGTRLLKSVGVPYVTINFYVVCNKII